MRGKIAAGIIAGLLTATALIGVVAVSYNAGRDEGRDDRTVQVVDNGETTTHVVEAGRGWHGPGFFGLVFPVLLVVLVVTFLTRRRHFGWHGYSGPWDRPGWGAGPCPPPAGGSAGGPGPHEPAPPPT